MEKKKSLILWRSKNITVNVVFNNVKNMNELAGIIAKQIELTVFHFLVLQKILF